MKRIGKKCKWQTRKWGRDDSGAEGVLAATPPQALFTVFFQDFEVSEGACLRP